MRILSDLFANTGISVRRKRVAMFARVTLLTAVLLAVFQTTLQCQAPAIEESKPPSTAEKNAVALDALEHARQSVDKFFAQSANVVCAESITQVILGKEGKTSYREESKYDYQLEATSASGTLKLKESREARKLPFRDPARTLLVTNGFASLLMIVHSSYEASYQFEPVGEQTIDGVTVEEIHFKPVPGGTSPAALQLRGKNYPLPLSGSIWIEKQTGAITRLTAEVDSSLKDLGLHGMRSDIHYSLIQFHEPEEAYWMPVSATIDLETPMQHWRNVHRFTAYRRFRATIEVEMEKPK
jgi:hypothetical protein